MKRLLILSMAILSACGLFKKSVKDVVDVKERTSLKSVLERSGQLQVSKEGKMFSVSGDSSKADMKLRIWPKGFFSFSLENGFSGGADSLVLEGGLVRGSFAADDILLKEKVLEKAQLKTVHAAEQVREQRKERLASVPALNWLFYSGMILVVWLFYRLGMFSRFWMYLKAIAGGLLGR